MDTAGDDRWRCASCGRTHESYNPPCMYCAGETLVRVGDEADEDDEGSDAGTTDESTDGFEWAETGNDRKRTDADHWIDDDWGDTGDRSGPASGDRNATAQQQSVNRSVEHLCKACGARYPDQKDVCPNCGGTDLAPIREVREAADAWADDWDGPTASSTSRGVFGIVSTIVAWAFGLLALLSGMGVLFLAVAEVNVGILLSGILATAAGLVSVPLTRRRLLRWAGLDLSHAQLVLLIVVLWVGGNLTLYATGTVPAGAV
ncbi:hypothetical protein [Haloarchaeobius sp. TZWSO28]|uniref:hypothetical protein n=1 Tax=Haloarchaeobius sp. TZWSO28 TaxID=3446119 RepID=UPI003EBEBF2D